MAGATTEPTPDTLDTPGGAREAARPPVLVDFALQGGGSHGAFTWGVLDRLLEEDWLAIEGISGTSAGAMNAAVLADGFAEGGAAGARAALARFWSEVSKAARFSPFQRGPLDRLLGRWMLDHSPMFIAMDLMSRLVSPYDSMPAAATRCAPPPPASSTRRRSITASMPMRTRPSRCGPAAGGCGGGEPRHVAGGAARSRRRIPRRAALGRDLAGGGERGVVDGGSAGRWRCAAPPIARAISAS